jgi:hypothetical protein
MSLTTGSLVRSAAPIPSIERDDRTPKKEQESNRSLHRIACWLGGAPSMTNVARPGRAGGGFERHSHDEVGGFRLD